MIETILKQLEDFQLKDLVRLKSKCNVEISKRSFDGFTDKQYRIEKEQVRIDEVNKK